MATNAQLISAYKEAHGITEAIHTYSRWKSMGYQVQKGSKALAKITIWKTAKRKKDDEEEEPRMFMKTASFFGESQVAHIEEA